MQSDYELFLDAVVAEYQATSVNGFINIKFVGTHPMEGDIYFSEAGEYGVTLDEAFKAALMADVAINIIN